MENKGHQPLTVSQSLFDIQLQPEDRFSTLPFLCYHIPRYVHHITRKPSVLCERVVLDTTAQEHSYLVV